MNKLVITMLSFVFVQIGFSQNYKLGKISKAELEAKYYPLDSTANAAYLYKKRRTYFNYIEGQGFQIVTEVQERIKIYNKNGYDWATKQIGYYSPESGESESIFIKEGKTFSLVDGKIVSYKLTKKDIFNENRNKYWSLKKFTMPNIKDGCIVEWKYTIHSPYRRINDVVIQYAIPVKRFESSVEIPEYYSYGVKQLGYLPVNIERDSKRGNIRLNNQKRTRNGTKVTSSYSTSEIDYEINMTKIEKVDIPALIEEPYVNDMDNYRSIIDYELTSIKWPNEIPKYFSHTWEDVAKDIINSSGFGGELKKIGHLKEDIAVLEAKNTSFNEKVISSLQYVKSKIKWNGTYGEYPELGLRKAYKEGSGNIGDINLTLVAVLKELGVETYPVLVSTRSNGVPLFPTREGINYVIVLAKTGENTVLLDASEKYSLPNVLPMRALNWNGIVIEKNEKVDFVKLESSVVSIEESNLKYKVSEDGFIEGLNRVIYENLKAINYRNGSGNLDQDDLISKIEVNNDAIEIVNFRLSNKDNIAKPVVEMYTFEKEDGVEVIADKMYITPMLFIANDENPFKLEQREYPIDFGAPWREKVTVSVEIPEGFKIESIPESIGIGLTKDFGRFVYSVKNVGTKINISSLLEINEGIVPALYYEDLKAFFKQVVSKQTEKIVLTKI